MNTLDARAAAERVRRFYEALQPGDVTRLPEIYAPHAYFRDPFNEVRGVAEVQRIFARMFAALADCRFVVRDTVVDERGALLVWDMTFRIRRLAPQESRSIRGVTHLKFDDAGRIVYHRDYWDAADELYAKLPVIGPVMRWLRKRLA